MGMTTFEKRYFSSKFYKKWSASYTIIHVHQNYSDRSKARSYLNYSRSNRNVLAFRICRNFTISLRTTEEDFEIIIYK